MNPAAIPFSPEHQAVLALMAAGRPCGWTNPGRLTQPPVSLPAEGKNISLADTQAAADRFQRFAGLLADLFPELRATAGQIESPLLAVPGLAPALGLAPSQGRLWLKADHLLPVAGSIKARGGLHEVLELAETLARRHGLLMPGEDKSADYRTLASPTARALFGRHQVAVGSTGNLGLSIGVAAAALGFRATVHMSADAKAWKKERLRRRGVEVVEHPGDYEAAVDAGRRAALDDPFCHFVDDERSLSLLLGYSAAALHLQQQLQQEGVVVDAEHPLFVYLPCGVGGAPAGITFGLRQLLGPHVHCFFAEPVQSPCFLLQMLAPPHSHPSVYDIGLANHTEADGLAVPRASLLAAGLMAPLLSGAFTVEDNSLFRQLVQVLDQTGLRIEPSAAAGFGGPVWLSSSEVGRAWLADQGLARHLPQANHLVWTTGGLFVPDQAFAQFEQRGRALLAG